MRNNIRKIARVGFVISVGIINPIILCVLSIVQVFSDQSNSFIVDLMAVLGLLFVGVYIGLILGVIIVVRMIEGSLDDIIKEDGEL